MLVAIDICDIVGDLALLEGSFWLLIDIISDDFGPLEILLFMKRLNLTKS